MTDPTLPPEHARLLRKLRSLGEVSPEEAGAIAALPMRSRSYLPHQPILLEGDRPEACGLIVEGFVHRYKDLAQGSRQILSFHVPGDIPDLLTMELKSLDHSLAAVTATRVAFIPHEALRALGAAHPRLWALLWRDTLVDGSIFREWMVNLGRRSAHARIAHLICELMVRFRSVGLTEGHAVESPLTQAELGDAVGLSTVHVNRVLQELRREGLVEWRGRRISTQDWEGLTQAGGFDPGYLHLSPETAWAAQ